MKIGIYGDSFANFKGHYATTLQWEDHLNTIMPDTTTVNYGLSGSSLYYSYEKYVNAKHLYDKNIFVVTGPWRAFFRGFEYVHGADAVDHFLAGFNEYSDEDILHLNAIRDYYLYLMDGGERGAMHKLMYNEIIKDKNTLIIRAFDGVASYSTDTNIPLNLVANLDNHAVSGDIMDFRKYADLRGNHLNQHNCKILASKISNWIQTGEFDMQTIKEFREDSTNENFSLRK
jgi:hypothetical protein